MGTSTSRPKANKIDDEANNGLRKCEKKSRKKEEKKKKKEEKKKKKEEKKKKKEERKKNKEQKKNNKNTKNSHNGEVDLEKLLRRGSASSGSCYSLERRTRKQISPKEHKDAATLPKDRHGFELIPIPNLNGQSTSTVDTGSQHSRTLNCKEVEGKLLAYTLKRTSENSTKAIVEILDSAEDQTEPAPLGILEDRTACSEESGRDKEATVTMETSTEAAVEDSLPSAEIQKNAESKTEPVPLGVLDDQTDCNEEIDQGKEATVTKETPTEATVDDSVPSAEIQEKDESKTEPVPLGGLDDQTDCNEEIDQDKEATVPMDTPTEATVEDSLPSAEIQEKDEANTEPAHLGVLDDQTDCNEEIDQDKEATVPMDTPTEATVEDSVPSAEIQENDEPKTEPASLGVLEDETDNSQVSDRDKEAAVTKETPTEATVEDSVPSAEIQEKAKPKTELAPLGVLEDQTDCSEESDRDKEVTVLMKTPTEARVDDNIPSSEIKEKAEPKTELAPLGVLEDQTDCSEESDRDKEVTVLMKTPTEAKVDDNIPSAEIQENDEPKTEPASLGVLEDETDNSQVSDRDKEATVTKETPTEATVEDSVPSAEIQEKAEPKTELAPLGVLEDQTDCSEESDRDMEATVPMETPTEARVDDNIPSSEIKEKAEPKTEPAPLGILEDQTDNIQESDRDKEVTVPMKTPTEARVEDSISSAEIKEKAEPKTEPAPLGVLEDQTDNIQESDRDKEVTIPMKTPTEARVDDNIPSSEIKEKAEPKTEPAPLGVFEDQTDNSQESDRDKEVTIPMKTPTEARVEDSVPSAEIKKKAEPNTEPAPVGVLEDQTDNSQESDRDKEVTIPMKTPTEGRVDDNIPSSEIKEKAEPKTEPAPLGVLEDQTDNIQESDRDKEVTIPMKTPTEARVEDSVPSAEIKEKAEPKTEPAPLGVLEDQTDNIQESDRDKEVTIPMKTPTEATVEDSVPSAEIQENAEPKTEPAPLGVLEDQTDNSQESDRDKEATVTKETPTEATVEDSVPSAEIQENAEPKTEPAPLGVLGDQTDNSQESDRDKEATVTKETPTEATVEDNIPSAEIQENAEPKTEPAPLGVFEDQADNSQESDRDKGATVTKETPTEATIEDSVPSAEIQENDKPKSEPAPLGVFEDQADNSQESDRDKEATVTKETPTEATIEDSVPSAEIQENDKPKSEPAPLGILEDQADYIQENDRDKEATVPMETPTEATAIDHILSTDIRKDTVQNTDPDSLDKLGDRVDADKRSEPLEEGVTVGKERPTEEGTNNHTLLDGDSQVARHTGEVGNLSAIPGDGTQRVRKIAITDRPVVLYNEDGTIIDLDSPQRDGTASTHGSTHSIQSDDSVVVDVDGCFISKEHRSDSFIEIERATGDFHRNYFEASSVYLMAENNTDEVDGIVGPPTAKEDAIEGASSSLAASGCSYMQSEKQLQQHSAEILEVDSEAPMLPGRYCHENVSMEKEVGICHYVMEDVSVSGLIDDLEKMMSYETTIKEHVKGGSEVETFENPTLKSLAEQVEAPPVKTAIVKRNASESLATLGFPVRPFGTPDYGESVEVPHGLAGRNNENRTSRYCLCADSICKEKPRQKSSDDMQIKELLENENGKMKERDILCEENERKNSKQYVKVTKNVLSDTNEQLLKDAGAQDISNSHVKEGHLNDVGIVEKNTGEPETLGNGVAYVENVVNQQEDHQNNDLDRLEKEAQGTHLEHGVVNDGENEITPCPMKVVDVQVKMSDDVAHGAAMEDSGVGMIGAVSIANPCNEEIEGNCEKEIVAKNSEKSEDRQQLSEGLDGLYPRKAMVEARSEGYLELNKAHSASIGSNEQQSEREANMVENAEGNLSVCSSTSDHYPSNDQKEGPLACLCACGDCGNFISIEDECCTEKETVVAYLTRNNSEQPYSLNDLSTGVNSSYPISSTVSMEHVEDEWIVRAYYSDEEFEEGASNGRYGNVDADDAEIVIDAELFQDGEEDLNNVKSASLGDC